MQDRFKFRIWDKKLKKIAKWGDNPYHNMEIMNYICVENPVTDWRHEDYILMQCTGLKDKNGKLIYEGDIVRLFCDEFENIHTVKFGDFAMYSLDFQTEYEKGSTAVYGYYLGGLKYPIPLSISLDTSGMQIEVIGNIYENPEVIGGAK